MILKTFGSSLTTGGILPENATTDEVADAKWMTKSEIKEYYRSGKLVPTLAYFLNDFNREERHTKWNDIRYATKRHHPSP